MFARHATGKIGMRLRCVVVVQIPRKQGKRLSELVCISGHWRDLVPLVCSLKDDRLPWLREDAHVWLAVEIAFDYQLATVLRIPCRVHAHHD